jgi:hypothetical protein
MNPGISSATTIVLSEEEHCKGNFWRFRPVEPLRTVGALIQQMSDLVLCFCFGSGGLFPVVSWRTKANGSPAFNYLSAVYPNKFKAKSS